jgi:asparagine synthase (glutamine-hydrolysing)
MYFNGKNANFNSLKKFNDTLTHRGPDGEGFFITEDKCVGLGHRRLAILDLSDKGKQPMSYLNGRYQITFNGEIYNFIELRKELQYYGYNFISDSDTEVIMAAYDKWDVECLNKFNGMWAFAIWDNEKRHLFLARDRFGIKPLYYTHQPSSFFAFSSETISFKQLDGFKKEIDEKNLTKVLQDSFSLEGFGKTIFKNIQQVLPGHCIILDKKGELDIKRWWNTADNLQAIQSTYEEQVIMFKDIFFDSCKLRMRSDVSIATALSGGLDSSSVYCAIHRLMRSNFDKTRTPNNWQKAFVATFPNTSVDEEQYAKKVVEYVKGEADYIKPDYANLINDIVESTIKFDSVYLGPVHVAGCVYSNMRNNGYKISMDGHGVDEMMFGYADMVSSAYYDALLKGDKAYASDVLNIYTEMQLSENKLIALNNLQHNSNFLRLFARKMFEKIPIAKKIYNTFAKNSISNWLVSPQLQSFNFQIAEYSDRDCLGNIVYNIFHKTTLPTILRNFDRASMQYGIEIRMPFMDWRLVSLVFSLPTESKLGNGFTKRILRDSMKNIVPESIRTRKKKIGINAPLVDWYKGPLKDFVFDEVNSSKFLHSNIWHGKIIRDFVEQKINNKSWTYADCSNIWQLINTNILLNNL